MLIPKWYAFISNRALWYFSDKPILHQRSLKCHISIPMQPKYVDLFNHLWLITNMYGKWGGEMKNKLVKIHFQNELSFF